MESTPPPDAIASLREDINIINRWIELAIERDANATIVQAAGMVRDERQARLDQLEMQ